MTEHTYKPAQVEVAMGAMSKPLSEQLSPFGLPEEKICQLQKIADSITRLTILGYIPSSQTERSRKKLFKQK